MAGGAAEATGQEQSMGWGMHSAWVRLKARASAVGVPRHERQARASGPTTHQASVTARHGLPCSVASANLRACDAAWAAEQANKQPTNKARRVGKWVQLWGHAMLLPRQLSLPQTVTWPAACHPRTGPSRWHQHVPSTSQPQHHITPLQRAEPLAHTAGRQGPGHSSEGAATGALCVPLGRH